MKQCTPARSSRGGVKCSLARMTPTTEGSRLTSLFGLASALACSQSRRRGDQPPDGQTERSNTQQRSPRVKMNEPRASRTDLQRPHRRHADPATTACALCIGVRFIASAPIDRPLPGAKRSAAAAGAEPECHVCDRNYSLVSALNRLAIDVPNAQAALEEFGNRGKWCGGRHDVLRRKSKGSSRARSTCVGRVLPVDITSCASSEAAT